MKVGKEGKVQLRRRCSICSFPPLTRQSATRSSSREEQSHEAASKDATNSVGEGVDGIGSVKEKSNRSTKDARLPYCSVPSSSSSSPVSVSLALLLPLLPPWLLGTSSVRGRLAGGMAEALAPSLLS